MNAPTQLDQALEALRQEHRSIAPPPSLEASILRQAQLSAPRHTVRNWSLALATAATLAAAIVLLYPRSSHPTETHTTTPLPPQTAQAPSIAVTPATAATRQTARTRPRRVAPRHSSPKPTPGPFVLLPTGVGLPEPTQAMLVRTRIDTSSLRSYGLAPPPLGAPQTILAEFLVGEDGLPRAIRLVR
jgi:hypothetical protein